MNLTPRAVLARFTQIFQLELFPEVVSNAGPLGAQTQLLVQTLGLLPLDMFLPKERQGRPREHRKAILAAFLAKSIHNLPDTRHLIRRLQQDEQLRRLCGWTTAAQLPSESTFSRAFAQFAHTQLGERLHAAIVEATQRGRLVGHVVRDSTAIEVRERFPDAPPSKKQKAKQGRKPKRGFYQRAKAAARGTLIQRQRHHGLPEMLAALPRQCALGVKTNSKGYENYWRGYKLHLDGADGQIPISALLTSASVHDVNAAIPLMTMTAARVDYCHECAGRLAES
ncbi:transposase [Nostoc sp. NIES-2111]